jgi:dipeptidyl aminopeptidase/acylaminoacyl peptidase
MVTLGRGVARYHHLLRVSTLLCSGLLCAGLSCEIACAAAGTAINAPHPFGVDDYLKLENTGRAVIDPTSRWLVYEKIPPYDQLPDYSVGRIGTWYGEGGHLMAVDLAAAEPSPRLLFSPDPEAVYWIDGFSPDGHRLAFYCVREGHVTEGLYDFDTQTVQSFEPAPRVDWIEGHTSTWISPDRMVYAAEAPGRQPASLSLRRYTGERFTEEWRKAWKGKEPASSVVTSHADGGGHERLEGRLIEVDARTGRTKVLSEGQFDNLQISADGRYLAALRQSTLPQPDLTRSVDDWVSARSELTVFDLERGGEPRVVAPDVSVFPGSLTWASDADRLAFFGWDFSQGVRKGVFRALDARNGRVTLFPHIGLDLASERERGYFQRPERAVWMGERLAIFARASEDPRSEPRFTYRDIATTKTVQVTKADWFLLEPGGKSTNLTASLKNVSPIPVHATANQLFVLAAGHVWRLTSGRGPADVTPEIAGELAYPSSVRNTTRRAPFTGEGTFEIKSKERSQLALVDLRRTSSIKTLIADSPSMQSRLMAASAAAGAILFREDTDQGAVVVLNRAAAGGGPRIVLDRLNAGLAQVEQDRWTRIRYSVGAGRDLESCVLLPPGFRADRRYPTIVEVYPGRGASCRESSTNSIDATPGSYSVHLLAARGYVVIEPATPNDLDATPQGPLAGMPALVLKALDAGIQQGYVDAGRVGLLGLSQGGIAALWVAGQTDRFKAVVALNSWSDLWSHYFEGSEPVYSRFYPEDFPYVGDASRYEATAGSEFSMGGTPWTDPDTYIRNSPLFHVDSITAPVMLVHSDMDGFPLAQFDEMFTALYRKRKEAVFVRYWGEGHSPSSPANIRDMWERILGWYDKYCGVRH